MCLWLVYVVEDVVIGDVFEDFVFEIVFVFGCECLDEMFDFEYVDVVVVCVCEDE